MSPAPTDLPTRWQPMFDSLSKLALSEPQRFRVEAKDIPRAVRSSAAAMAERSLEPRVIWISMTPNAMAAAVAPFVGFFLKTENTFSVKPGWTLSVLIERTLRREFRTTDAADSRTPCQ